MVSEKVPTLMSEAAVGLACTRDPQPHQLFADLSLLAGPLAASPRAAGPSRLQARKEQHTL